MYPCIQREKDFLDRLNHHRFSEFQKFEDDYYGDKIATLSDYRQWVRQQDKKKEVAKRLKAADTTQTNDKK